jgi:peptidoglycan DL-endopeptidase CwlO
MTLPDSPRLRRTCRFALAAITLVLGCAGPGVSLRDEGERTMPAADPQAREPRTRPAGSVEAVLAGARATLGRTNPEIDGRRIPTDCSGYVRALYTRAGVDLFSESLPGDNGVRAILRWIERHGFFHRQKLPAAGDLVFFDNSYDRNGDGRLNDPLTHVGLVEKVLPDGTALIVHATNHGIVSEPMNLIRPHDAADLDGRQLNAFLRRKGTRDAAHTPHLMAELFAGFGSVFHREPATAASVQDPASAPHGRASRRLAR